MKKLTQNLLFVFLFTFSFNQACIAQDNSVKETGKIYFLRSTGFAASSPINFKRTPEPFPKELELLSGPLLVPLYRP
jgi:hypothetical protein